MNIRTYSIAVTTTGDAGAATGSATSETILGEIIDIYIDYHASAPATTDVTIAHAARGGDILAVANSATDALYHPRAAPVTAAAAAITNSYVPFVLSQPVTVSVAQCDALASAVTVSIRVRS